MDVMRCFPEQVRQSVMSCGTDLRLISEIRLRAGTCSAVSYISDGEVHMQPLPSLVLGEDDLRGMLGRLCGGSVHVYDEGLLQGYFSPSFLQGVRVGVAGRLLMAGGRPIRLQHLTSLCIRLPYASQRFRGQPSLSAVVRGNGIPEHYRRFDMCAPPHEPIRSTLIYAPPGIGKTTFLRCLIRDLCSVGTSGTPVTAAVLDAGEEVMAGDFADCTADRFSGYPRGLAMEIATRAFAPQVLICDEIGSDGEAEEILRAQACGVPLIATAHADCLETLLRRPCFARLHDYHVFSRYLRLFRGTGNTGFAFAEEHACTRA